MASGQAFLAELHEFLQFLRSLWGTLAGVSVLFPLSNALVAVVPIGGGGNPFQNLSPGIVTTVTTMTCVFLTFATFAQRKHFPARRRRARYQKTARFSFGVALGALAIYVLTSDALYRALVSDTNGDELGIALYDGLFAALYVATFALLTRAFLLLAMLEYFPEESAEPAPAG